MLVARRFGRDGPARRAAPRAATVDEVIYAEIAERRADPDLGRARRHPLDAGRGAVRRRRADVATPSFATSSITLLLAGHETTATALAWTFDLLLRNPARAGAPARRARRGRRRVPARGDHRVAAAAAGGPARRAGGWAPSCGSASTCCPPGTDVTPAFWLTHTRPDLYPQPLEFRPERFLADPPETYAWVPFGGGVRRCLGAAFAEFEMRVVLREVLTRCELRGARSAPGADRAAQHHLLAAARHAGRHARVRREPALLSPRAKLAAPGRLAQLGERRLDKAEVAGSSPAVPISRRPSRLALTCAG